MDHLDLDLDHDRHDLELAKFQSLVFNKILIKYEQLANDPRHRWNQQDLVYISEGLLKAWDAYQMWGRTQSNYYRASWMVLLSKVLWALLKELTGRRA